jgi:hypothetical protein
MGSCPGRSLAKNWQRAVPGDKKDVCYFFKISEAEECAGWKLTQLGSESVSVEGIRGARETRRRISLYKS